MGDDDKNVWMSLQRTEGQSDLYIQSNVWQVGASTGWHTHPGHSLIIVTSGTLTEYMADCLPHVYTFVPGQPAPTLVDPGHGHVHIIRNESSVLASKLPSNSFRSIRTRRIAELMLQPRRAAPTFCKRRGADRCRSE
jgi:hypothetical protein